MHKMWIGNLFLATLIKLCLQKIGMLIEPLTGFANTSTQRRKLETSDFFIVSC